MSNLATTDGLNKYMKNNFTIYGHFHQNKSWWQRMCRKFLPKLYFRKILKNGSYINKNEEFFKQFVEKDYVKSKSKTISNKRT